MRATTSIASAGPACRAARSATTPAARAASRSIFYYGRWRQASDAAGRIRARRWWGVDVGDREVYLWGAPVELEQDRPHQDAPRPAAQPAGAQRLRDVRGRTWMRISKRCRRSGPGASTATRAAWRCWRRAPASAGSACSLPELRVVCTTGEPLYPHQRTADRAGIRRPGGQRIRQPRHRLHRARNAARADVADEREHHPGGAGPGRPPGAQTANSAKR